MRTLLLSCYELGHQPLSLAWPLAALEQAGYSARALDLSVAPLRGRDIRDADVFAISVPMHTALRLGVDVARRIRKKNPDAHIAFYGLYAWMNAPYLFDEGLVDSVIGGEAEPALVSLVTALTNGTPTEDVPGVYTTPPQTPPHLPRVSLPVPSRTELPLPEHYARLMEDGTAWLAGYAETTRGCLHTCAHCPVVPVYGGRFFAVPLETVMADIHQQVAEGVRHISFGDPDFLNGPTHALRVARALHAAFPHVTFDATIKVEHIVKYPDVLAKLRKLGAIFVISAFESVSDLVLHRLKKGHTRLEMDTALEILRAAELPVQPTWVAFTPWTTIDDYLDMLTWVRERRLITHVPIVQYAIRLLVPPQSILLTDPDVDAWLGKLDAANFTYRWDHPDPRMDDLYRRVAHLAEGYADADPYDAFRALETLAYEVAGRTPSAWVLPERILPPPPRLTEDWFC